MNENECIMKSEDFTHQFANFFHSYSSARLDIFFDKFLSQLFSRPKKDAFRVTEPRHHTLAKKIVSNSLVHKMLGLAHKITGRLDSIIHELYSVGKAVK
jgi:hypothetical protein